jgi:ectoine hydroxylase-related dioxygenase (phytanoyl-CoA dioxygenase family)
MTPEALILTKDGAQLFKAGLSIAELVEVEGALGSQPKDHAGVRLSGIPKLLPFLAADGPVGRIAASALGPQCFPVRAILFDKSAGQNWSLGWHQDRTIAVRQRLDIDGFGPWSVKSGMVHVEPPFDLLAGMVTVRIHLDDVPETNAPLLIAPGSHKRGRIPVAEIPDVVRECGMITCTAAAGDIWLYATPILHASEAAAEPHHRRVLQVDYAVGELPGGLQWLGV